MTNTASQTATSSPTATPTATATLTPTDTATLTPTSTPLSVLIQQPTEPSPASYLPGTSGVTAIVAGLSNTGNAPATLNSLVFSVPGTGNTQATVGLYNSNLILIGSGAFLSGATSVTITSGSFLDVLAANSAVTYTLIFDFSGSGTGSITANLAASGVSLTAAAGANVSGTATGPTMTIANPSPTPTTTASFTATSTTTLTPTSTATSTTTNTATSTVSDTPTITQTPTSTPANVFLGPVNEPPSNSYVPGTLGVTLVNITLTNAGTASANIESMAFSVTGSGDDYDDTTELYMFKNSGPTTFAKNSFQQSGANAVTFGTGTSTFDTLAVGASVTYTLTADFTTFGTGTFTADVLSSGVSVSSGSGVVVTGSVTGPTITISLATSTPTNTATNTATSTTTDTTTSTATTTPTFTPTSTPTNEVVSIVQPTEPPNTSYLIGSTGVTVLLANLSNPGTQSVTLADLSFTLTESGNPWTDVNKVWLYRNGNPSPLADASFNVGAHSVTFAGVPFDSLAAGAAVSYTLTYDFAGSASGSFATNIGSSQVQGGLSAGGPIVVNGSATGPSITLGTATPTSTPSSTATVTPTSTPTFNIPDPNLRLGILMSLGSPTPTSGTPADIPLSVLQSAVSINASNLGVTSIYGLQKCTNLFTLNIQSDNVTDLTPLSGLTSLFALHMDYNQNLSNLAPLSGLTSLGILEVRGGTAANPFGTPGLITSIAPLAGLTSLIELEISNQPVTSLAPIAGLTQLQQLFIIGCNPTTGFTGGIAALSSLSSLQLLDASNDAITDISSLANLTSLQTVDLSSNLGVTNISALANLRNAQAVTLESDGITGMPALANLGNTTTSLSLDITNNPVTDISGLSTTTVPGLSANGSTLNITSDITDDPNINIQKGIIQSKYPRLTITGP